MRAARTLLALALLTPLAATAARADCQIGDAKLEEAIAQKPQLRGAANRQTVRELRSLRDAAFILWSYGRHDDCERLVANIRELLSGPSIATLGDNDEEEADRQIGAREPKARRGAVQGRRADRDAKPLLAVATLVQGLRSDQFIGAEVRSSDDRIVGEVRNIVFGTGDRRDYAIVASGGFFTAGKASIVVPIRTLRISQERDVLYLPMVDAEVRTLPPMPDEAYRWLEDNEWRARNEARFMPRDVAP
jgi:hypothetical protein